MVKSLKANESLLCYIRKFSFVRHLEYSGHFELNIWQNKNIFLEFVLQENAKIFAL
jgi:hypothetical protein